MTSSAPTVRTDTEGSIVTITLDRPDRMNTMNDQLLDELLAAVESAASDPGVRVIVLTGSGRAFCAGGDMVNFNDGALVAPVPLETQIRGLRTHMRIVTLLRECAAVTIAAVNGAAAGAGLSLALACDLRFSSARAVFRSAFVDAGLSGDFGGTWLLTHLIGESRARRMYLLNEKITAEQALDWGLASAVFAPDDFEAGWRSAAAAMAAKAPLTLAAIKQNFLDAATVDFATACDREAVRHTVCSRTADAAEAAAAFVEKRSPSFSGS